MAASRNAIFLLLFLIKNETVIGIIGNTQGVSNAVSPLKKARINNPMKPSLFSSPAMPLNVFAAPDFPLR